MPSPTSLLTHCWVAPTWSTRSVSVHPGQVGIGVPGSVSATHATSSCVWLTVDSSSLISMAISFAVWDCAIPSGALQTFVDGRTHRRLEAQDRPAHRLETRSIFGDLITAAARRRSDPSGAIEGCALCTDECTISLYKQHFDGDMPRVTVNAEQPPHS
jgi:hypothetical protein